MRRKVILVAEDDTQTRIRLLEALGDTYTVWGVSNGSDALAIMERFSVALAIFDNNLPARTGMEIIEELQQRQAAVPTILVSGLMDRGLAQRALQAGAVMVFRKPLDLNRLRARIAALMTCTDPGSRDGADYQEVWNDHVSRMALRCLPHGGGRDDIDL